MIVIGASALAEYGEAHPQAGSALRALNALLRQASWRARDEIARDCGAVARFVSEDAVALALPHVGCSVAFRVNFELGVIRITAVTALNEEDAR
ncbi:hypothetical protein AB4Z40_26620 [Bosea sp. 2YAB26]|uniref:hypothetical protein n=1 Tax=Bosea sp. 2YAB26 TaxID=3237478 RepID=UPI003F901CDB